MSERKSWDVQPSRRPVHAPAPAPAPRPQPTRKKAQPPEPRTVRTAPKRPAPVPSGTLKERRKKKRQTLRYVWLVLLVLLIAGAFYMLWMPTFRIQSVSAQGPSADTAKTVVSMKLSGTYWHVIPRNSVFFYPKDGIRAAVLDAVPDVSAVSLIRTSFSSIEIRTTSRAASFVWCGTSIDLPREGGACFDADIEGLIFKPSATVSSASSTTGSAVRVFSLLDRDVDEGQSPLRAHIASPSVIPDALKFVGAIKSLDAPVSALAIRGDEADLWLSGPTRITYILGHETQAASVAASALPSLTLTDGSIQYVDLRFPGKAYVKRYGE